MIVAENCFINCINAPVRKVLARVELYKDSTLIDTYKYNGALKSFSIERVGDESKFFGFGICQKLNVKLLDPNREINITTENTLEAVFGTGCDYVYTNPIFYVTEVHRDENTNELSITAYDAIYNSKSYKVKDLDILPPYTIKRFVSTCCAYLGLPVVIDEAAESSFNTVYNTGANFEGTEDLREALNAVAEATQTIYYINSNWELFFKRLDVSGEAVLTIDKEKYFDLDSKTNRRLKQVAHITDLGDNVAAENNTSGTIQYIRNNPFWELREDIATLVNNADAAVSGLTINQFSCSWRGNYLLEIGDKIALVTKDNKTVNSYLLNDTIEYNGALIQNTSWSYGGSEDETETNPTTLGDALKQTYARVDKANKEITLLATKTESNRDEIATLKVNTDSIITSVKAVEEATQKNTENINNDIAELESKITQTAENLNIEFTNKIGEIDSVTTSTGFTFNKDGLTVSKSGSEMTTQITDDGMKVYRDNTEMLTANNHGVKAVNLHATTYLIIGNNSRFEDIGSSRTGCFWIRG